MQILVLKVLEKLASLFPQDMIQDLLSFHWNTIHESIGVARSVGLYKLIRLGIPESVLIDAT